ncbi:MAG: hypothetical protein MI784_06085, partial [Cytophagales bacterium]|nr:hypothetical protein [Cytophagales bacterium]
MINCVLSTFRVASGPVAGSRRLASLICLAFVVLLAGCKLNDPGLFVSGTEAQHSPESQNGLVLVGIRTNDGNPLYWSIGFRLTGEVEVNWRRFDPETDRLLYAAGNRFRSYRHWC